MLQEEGCNTTFYISLISLPACAAINLIYSGKLTCLSLYRLLDRFNIPVICCLSYFYTILEMTLSQLEYSPRFMDWKIMFTLRKALGKNPCPSPDKIDKYMIIALSYRYIRTNSHFLRKIFHFKGLQTGKQPPISINSLL